MKDGKTEERKKEKRTMAVKIQVLGTGCAKCADLARNAESAAKALGIAYELEKVTDVQKIMLFGVMSTPGLVVDGKVVSSGKVLSPEEIKAILNPSCAASAAESIPSGCGCAGGGVAKAGAQACACTTQGGGCCGRGGRGAMLRLWLFPLLAVAVAGLLWLKSKNEAKAEPARPAAGVPAKSEMRPVQVKPLPKLVDLGAVGCKPCKIMDGVLEELRKEYTGKLAVEFINVRTEEAKADAYKINLIPTQVWLDASGKELFRHEGVMSAADIVAKFKELGIDLGRPAATPAATPAAAGAEEICPPPVSGSGSGCCP